MTTDQQISQQLSDSPTGLRLWAIRIFVFVIATVLFSILGEVVVRWVAPQPLNGRWTETGRRGLQINKANWSARHDASGHTVTYRFNGQHLRGGTIQGAKRRILALGDSFTFGWLLEEHQTYVQRLARQCDETFGKGEYEWLNGARGGWGTADYATFLEEYGDSLRPDIIIVFLNFDDIRRSTKSVLYAPLSSDSLTLAAQSQPVCWLTVIADSVPCYDWLLSHSHLVNLVRKSIGSLLHRRPGPGSSEPAVVQQLPAADSPQQANQDHTSAVQLGKSLFLRMKDWCDQRNRTLLVVTTGYQAKYLGPTSVSCDRAFLIEAEQFFYDAQIPFRDNSASLQQLIGDRWEEYTIEGDGHANAAGAALVANCISTWLFAQLESLHHHDLIPNIAAEIDQP